MLVKDNKYIPQEDKDFFILLRIGLWQKACPEPVEWVTEELSPNPDWEYIYTLACEQTVQGVIADGIGLYRKQYPDLNISQAENDKFLSASAQIVRRNYAINALQARICKIFNEQDVRYVVMKGQTVAQYYPKPNLRCSGDIDYFFEDQHYELAKILLEPLADNKGREKEWIKHCSFDFGDIEVELHSEEGHNLHIEEPFRKVKNDIFSTQLQTYQCNEIAVNIPPATFDIVYSYLHIANHYIREGIGLRQLCDFSMILSNRFDEIDERQLQKYLKELRLERGWNILISFSEYFLGAETSKTSAFRNTIKTNNLFKPDIIKTIKSFWEQCKETGNFGHNNEYVPTDKSNKGFVSRNIHVLKTTHQNAKRLFVFSPSIALDSYKQLFSTYTTVGFQKLFHKNNSK